ncbi:MAG: DNA polymerase IV [Coriobacteriales bacterium]|jgi:DNA polymerase-4|nr:DNA polymerase IV [Coriobacteriales bacterium]
MSKPIYKDWDGPAILLLDLDAFFASVEQLDHPEWRGKPVIVGGDPGRRGVVSTCSYEARKYGVRSAMPSATAAKLCPDAIWTAGNFPRYIELSNQVMQIMRDVSPHLQQVSIDEAFLDVSPGRYIRDHPVELAGNISQRVSDLGITCSIGLGSSKTVAKIASDQDKPHGLTVVYPGSEASFLAPLPVRALSGIGPQSAKRLEKFGIRTLGQLASAETELLHELFGKNTDAVRQRCLGIDSSPIDTDDIVKSVSNEMTFSTDLIDESEICAAIEMMSTRVGRRLRHKHLAGFTVTLKLRYNDLSIRTVQRTQQEPMDNEWRFAPIAISLLPQIWRPGDAVRLVGVGISGFDIGTDSTDLQLSLFETPVEDTKSGPLAEATDRVRDRFGEYAVSCGRDFRFRRRDTGTIGQKKDDYKDPLHAPDEMDE